MPGRVNRLGLSASFNQIRQHCAKKTQPLRRIPNLVWTASRANLTKLRERPRNYMVCIPWLRLCNITVKQPEQLSGGRADILKVTARVGRTACVMSQRDPVIKILRSSVDQPLSEFDFTLVR